MFFDPRFLKSGGTGGGAGSGIAHETYPPGQIHTPFNWVVANAAAKTALTPVAADVYKTLLQLDTGEEYVLTNHSPVTWVLISGSSGGSAIATVNYGPAFQAATSSAQTLAVGVNVIIAQTESYDTHNCYNPTTGTFTADRDGYYTFAGYAFNNSPGFPANTSLSIRRTRGGTTSTAWQGLNPSVANSEYALIFSCQLELLLGDIVDVTVIPGSASSCTMRWAGAFMRPLVNSVVGSGFGNINVPIAVLKGGSVVSVVNSVATTVTYTTESIDDIDAINMAFPTRITVPVGSLFNRIRFTTRCIWPTHTGADSSGRGVRVIKNGNTSDIVHDSITMQAENTTAGASLGGMNTLVLQTTSMWLPCVAGDYFELQAIQFDDNNLNYQPGSFQAEFSYPVATGSSTGSREVLTADRTYYVRTDGNDNNTGLVDSAAGAFLTIQAAINRASIVDGRIYNITIQLGNGTYAGFTANAPFLTTGIVKVQGNIATPASTIVNGAITAANGAILSVESLKSTSTSSFCLYSNNGSLLRYSNIDFGAGTTSSHMRASAAVIQATGNYTISGASPRHWNAVFGGSIFCSNRTITLTGTPAFSFAFADADGIGNMELYNNTYTGAATGKRYSVTMNGIVQTYATATLPGNIGGTIGTGGQYA